MKPRYISISLLAFSMLVLAATETVFQKLNIQREEAANFVVSSIGTGTLKYPFKACKTIDLSARPELCISILSFAKEYTTTESFKNSYDLWLYYAEPIPPQTLEEMKAEQAEEARMKAEQQKEALHQLKRELARTKDAEERKSLQAAVNELIELEKALRIPSGNSDLSEMNADVEKIEEIARLEATLKFNKEHAEWEKLRNPNVRIKNFIRYYLDLVETVDFGAETKADEKNRLIFVNPEFEAKPKEWKQIYRAGKTVNDAAKIFAEKWLDELEAHSVPMPSKQ